MESVLLSVRPKWCELIANGTKTVEVRKTKPKLNTPFKCYIYCTLPPKEELLNFGSFREYANELIRLQDGLIVYDYGMRVCCDIEGRPYSQDNFLCKKVIGEFICDYILQFTKDDYDSPYDISDDDLSKTCLRQEDLYQYGKGKTLYGWHISNLVIYDTPKVLGEFKKINRECWYADLGLAKRDCSKCRDENCFVSRPPQSWCYVEDIVYCKDCKHLMFSDCYAECEKAYKGIVAPYDYCDKGELK